MYNGSVFSHSNPELIPADIKRTDHPPATQCGLQNCCITAARCLLYTRPVPIVRGEDSKAEPPPRRRDMTNENFEVVGRLMDRLEVGPRVSEEMKSEKQLFV